MSDFSGHLHAFLNEEIESCSTAFKQGPGPAAEFEKDLDEKFARLESEPWFADVRQPFKQTLLRNARSYIQREVNYTKKIQNVLHSGL